MIATESNSGIFVIDGVAVSLTFYSDTKVLRMHNRAGRFVRESRWSGSWDALVALLEPEGGCNYAIDARPSRRKIASGDALVA
ncbi:hypothetical protein D0B32_27875 [Paraburkholderia sp. DHOC27]|nr:hypothetical protein D0B32_27875 [Paraburkholderia sp. DHOC27]